MIKWIKVIGLAFFCFIIISVVGKAKAFWPGEVDPNLPDLTFSSILFYNNGDLGVEVVNNSDVSSGEPSHVTLYGFRIDADENAEVFRDSFASDSGPCSIPELGPHATTSCMFPLGVRSMFNPDRGILFKIDDQHWVRESIEYNNWWTDDLGPKSALSGRDYAELILRQLGYTPNEEESEEARQVREGLGVQEAVGFTEKELVRDDLVGVSYGSLSENQDEYTTSSEGDSSSLTSSDDSEFISSNNTAVQQDGDAVSEDILEQDEQAIVEEISHEMENESEQEESQTSEQEPVGEENSSAQQEEATSTEMNSVDETGVSEQPTSEPLTNTSEDIVEDGDTDEQSSGQAHPVETEEAAPVGQAPVLVNENREVSGSQPSSGTQIPSSSNEENTYTSAVTVDYDSNNTSQENRQTKEPQKQGMLPDNPFYFIKNAFQEARVGLTFNPEKKATIRLTYARDKILEAYALNEKGKSDAVVKHLDKYRRDLSKAAAAIGKVQTKNSDTSQELSQTLMTNALRHQLLLTYLEPGLSDNNNNFDTVQQELHGVMGAVAERLSATDIQTAVYDGLSGSGSEYRLLSAMVVLRDLESYIEDDLKETVADAKNSVGATIYHTLDSLSVQDQELLLEYAQGVVPEADNIVEDIEEMKQVEVKHIDVDAIEKDNVIGGQLLDNGGSDDPSLNENTHNNQQSVTETEDDEEDSTSEVEDEVLGDDSDEGNDGICNGPYEPVCSVDGVTFFNICYADKLNIEIDYEGACQHDADQGNDQDSIDEIDPNNLPDDSIDTTWSNEEGDDDTTPDPELETEEEAEPEPEPEEEVVVRDPSFSISLTQNGNLYTVNGVINYYGIGGNCEGPRPNDPVIVRWGDGANEPAVNNMTFTASHEYHIENGSYTLSVSVYNSCYQMMTLTRTITFNL
ncbi:MAG TPA: hypothetical protein DCS29_02540 [Candidatus Magasanikbacteria bacterium]|nr:MAG: hypothetical protein A2479_00040 [Candidatus Magasanikbacteria bacterium RIFOXYC2_FULL_39_8]HAT03635.1 hypothetical protein [Candidatus Magasanikbacteria bacterium]